MKLLTHPLLLLAALFFSTPSAFCEAPQRRVIGAMAELSGPFSSIGDECRKGYEIAKAVSFEKHPELEKSVKVVFGDHQRDPKVGVSEFRRMVEFEKALAVISNGSPVGMTLAPIANADKVTLIGAVAVPKFTSGAYTFRFWLNGEKEGEALAEKARRMGFSRAALITLDDDYTVAMGDGFRRKFENGGAIVFEERILKTETDYAALLTRIRKSRPDVIFLNVLGDQLGVIIKRTREQGLNQQLVGTFSLAKKEVRDVAGETKLEGIIFLELDGEKPLFLAELKKHFGQDYATGLSYAAYVSMMAVLDTLAKYPSVSDKQSFYQAFLQSDRFPTLDGEIQMKDREAQFGTAYRVIRQGKIETLQ